MNKLKELNYFLNKTKQKNQALVVRRRIILFRLSIKGQIGREIWKTPMTIPNAGSWFCLEDLTFFFFCSYVFVSSSPLYNSTFKILLCIVLVEESTS